MLTALTSTFRPRVSSHPLRWAAVACAILICGGCDGRPVQTPKPVVKPTTLPTSMPTSVPATPVTTQTTGMGSPSAPVSPPLVKPPVRPKVPVRPEPTWTVFRQAFDDKADAICESRFSGGNRLDVRTENISHLTLDLGKLPATAPKKGPWNLQIDGQGIEVSGSRGRYLHLVRGKAGAWDVDRDAYKR